MKSILVITLTLAALSGCGGGSSSPPDNTAAFASQAIKNIAAAVPAPKVYSGAFAAIEGISIGYVSASSPDLAVRLIVAPIVADPVKHALLYKQLVNEGLRVTLFGDSIKDAQGNVVRGAASGLVLYAADSNYVATLRLDGLHVVQIN